MGRGPGFDQGFGGYRDAGMFADNTGQFQGLIKASLLKALLVEWRHHNEMGPMKLIMLLDALGQQGSQRPGKPDSVAELEVTDDFPDREFVMEQPKTLVIRWGFTQALAAGRVVGLRRQLDAADRAAEVQPGQVLLAGAANPVRLLMAVVAEQTVASSELGQQRPVPA